MIPTYIFRPFHLHICHVEQDSPCPKPRSGHRIVCDENSLYSFGGFNPVIEDDSNSDPVWLTTKPLFKELWKYNFASKKWRQMHILNIPKELASHAAILRGSLLIVYGGTGVPFGSLCSNEVHLFNIKCDYKMKLLNVNGTLPEKLYGQSIAIDEEDNLYTMGGTTGYVYYSDIHQLNLKTGEWKEVYIYHGDLKEPQPRYRHEIVIYDKKLWVFGGGTVNSVYGFKEIPVFDLITRSWDRIATLPDPTEPGLGVPLPRRCHGCVLLQSDNVIQHPAVYIIGGMNGIAESQEFTYVWKLDLITLSWHKMKRTFLPHQLYFHATTITPNGCLYSFGGIEITSWTTERTSTIYKTWLTIPKLSEIAWEACRYYNPKLATYNKKALLSIGIPLDFVERLDSL